MAAETEPQTGATAPATGTPKAKPRRIGVVTSDKMQKTITVVVDRLVKHPVYKKYVKERTVLKAHDEKNEARVGSVVEVEFSRPLSKTKRWSLVRVIRAADATARAPEIGSPEIGSSEGVQP